MASIFCGKRCQERKDRRLELKHETKQRRFEERTNRNSNKWNAKSTAYSMGIDPDAKKYEMFASLGQSAGGALSNILSPLSAAGGGSPHQQQNNSLVYIGAGILGLFLIMKK